MRARLGDDGTTVGVADQHDRPVLRVDDLPRRGDVTLERQGRVLDDVARQHQRLDLPERLETKVQPLSAGSVGFSSRRPQVGRVGRE